MVRKLSNFTDDMFYLSPSKDVDAEVDKIFAYYREHGFPNYNKADYDMPSEFCKLRKFNDGDILEGKTIKQNLTSQGILWTYFPHWTDVKCGNAKASLSELWNDDAELKHLIKKTYLWKLKHNEPHWTDNRIRQNAKVFLSPQAVSNFRPTVAKLIYNRYGNGGDVFDMSSGFGGRMFGFSASMCLTYTGLEPSTKTYDGLQELAKDLTYLSGKSIVVHKQGSEEFNESFVNRFDLCFTSPPYFNTEKYSDEETQSFKKFPKVDLWLDGFLRKTLENCYKYTKDGGHTIINIADTPLCKGLESATVEFAKKIGFTHEDTLEMELSSISGKKRKTEPVFVFKK